MNQYLSNHMLFATICFPYLVVTFVQTVLCVWQQHNEWIWVKTKAASETGREKQQLSKKVYNKIFTLFFYSW